MADEPRTLRQHDGWPAGGSAAVEAVRTFVLAAVRLYREGLADVLARSGGIDVVGIAAQADDAITAIARLRPEVAVLDVAGPGGLEIVRELRLEAPETRIVVLAVTEIDRDIVAWAEAGISGYVTRDGTLDDLVDAVMAAARGEARCTPRISAALLERVHALAAGRAASAGVTSLTAREREIAELLEAGLSNKEIATRLHIELPTVKNHVHSILGKLDVGRRADAVAELRRARLGMA